MEVRSRFAHCASRSSLTPLAGVRGALIVVGLARRAISLKLDRAKAKLTHTRLGVARVSIRYIPALLVNRACIPHVSGPHPGGALDVILGVDARAQHAGVDGAEIAVPITGRAGGEEAAASGTRREIGHCRGRGASSAEAQPHSVSQVVVYTV